MSRPGPKRKEIDMQRAALLYGSGLSLEAVAAHLNMGIVPHSGHRVSPSTVRARLLEGGVQLRPPKVKAIP
jgi:hypothetical protein